MKQNKIFLLIAGLTLTLAACNKDKWPCVNGSGSVISQTRTLSGFTSVSSEIEATVYVSQDTFFEVRIEAQQNVLDNIQTNISGGDLEIFSEHCINNSEPVKIYITMPSVSALSISGSGGIITQTRIITPSIDLDISGSGVVTVLDSIITDVLELDISGSGDMDFIGKATTTNASISGSGNMVMNGSGHTLNFDVSGSGQLHAFGFPVSIAGLTVSGSGDVEADVADEMNVEISGSGDIYYKGTPAITAEVSGSGKLIHVD